MTFDRRKVIDGLCDDLKQWVGWKGYFSDRLVALKIIVEEGQEDMYEVTRIRDGEAYPFNAANNDWQFFYPVEQPKKPKFVPFDNCQEMIDWYWDTGVDPKNDRPLIWVKHKGVGFDVLVSGYNNLFVCVENKWKNMRDLFREYTFLDGTPIGKEVEE